MVVETAPLPGWRLVWSLYGRFWCRSSLEVLRQWRTGARACGQGPCGAASPATNQPAHFIRDTAISDPQAPRPAVNCSFLAAAVALIARVCRDRFRPPPSDQMEKQARFECMLLVPLHSDYDFLAVSG